MYQLRILVLVFCFKLFKVSDCQSCQIPVVCGAGSTPGWMQYNLSGAGQIQCSFQSEVKVLTDRLANISKQLNDIQTRLRSTTQPTTLVGGLNAAAKQTTLAIAGDVKTPAAPVGVITTQQATTPSITDSVKLTTASGNCELRFNGSCYWASLVGATTTNFTSAQKLCTDFGGRLAGIYSSQHFARAHAYLYQKRAKRGVFSVWSGLIVTDEAAGAISLPNNSSAPSLNRVTDVNCQSGPSRVIMRLRSDVTTSGIGIAGENCRFFGAFCESRN